MLTTAGITCLTMGAKLGSCMRACGEVEDCSCGAVVCAPAMGAMTRPKPRTAATAAARTSLAERRRGDGVGSCDMRIPLDQFSEALKATICGAAQRGADTPRLGDHGLRPAFNGIKSV